MSGGELNVESIVRKDNIEDYYDVGKFLGRGKFATVKHLHERSTEKNFAAKYLRKLSYAENCRNTILQEAKLLLELLDNSVIVDVKEVFETCSHMVIVLELCTGGDLYHTITNEPLTEKESVYILKQVINGLVFLHGKHILHLDIKPENILLINDKTLDIKLADFGLAVKLTQGKEFKRIIGTPEYVAPEVIEFEPLTWASDIWSLGAVAYALLAGYSPFLPLDSDSSDEGDVPKLIEQQQILYNVSQGKYDFDDFEEISEEAKDFIRTLIVLKPTDRPSAERCLSHRWIKAYNDKTLPQRNNAVNSPTFSLYHSSGLSDTSDNSTNPGSSLSTKYSTTQSYISDYVTPENPQIEETKTEDETTSNIIKNPDQSAVKTKSDSEYLSPSLVKRNTSANAISDVDIDRDKIKTTTSDKNEKTEKILSKSSLHDELNTKQTNNTNQYSTTDSQNTQIIVSRQSPLEKMSNKEDRQSTESPTESSQVKAYRERNNTGSKKKNSISIKGKRIVPRSDTKLIIWPDGQGFTNWKNETEQLNGSCEISKSNDSNLQNDHLTYSRDCETSKKTDTSSMNTRNKSEEKNASSTASSNRSSPLTLIRKDSHRITEAKKIFSSSTELKKEARPNDLTARYLEIEKIRRDQNLDTYYKHYNRLSTATSNIPDLSASHRATISSYNRVSTPVSSFRTKSPFIETPFSTRTSSSNLSNSLKSSINSERVFRNRSPTPEHRKSTQNNDLHLKINTNYQSNCTDVSSVSPVIKSKSYNTNLNQANNEFKSRFVRRTSVEYGLSPVKEGKNSLQPKLVSTTPYVHRSSLARRTSALPRSQSEENILDANDSDECSTRPTSSNSVQSAITTYSSPGHRFPRPSYSFEDKEDTFKLIPTKLTDSSNDSSRCTKNILQTYSARNSPITPDPTDKQLDFNYKNILSESRPRFDSDPSCLIDKIAIKRKFSADVMSVDKVHLSLKAYKEHFNNSYTKENFKTITDNNNNTHKKLVRNISIQGTKLGYSHHASTSSVSPYSSTENLLEPSHPRPYHSNTHNYSLRKRHESEKEEPYLMPFQEKYKLTERSNSYHNLSHEDNSIMNSPRTSNNHFNTWGKRSKNKIIHRSTNIDK